MNIQQRNTQNIDALLKRRRILLTCGTGGVGKTSLSAALAIRAVLSGRKTVVMTIDPAKRLASALGLSQKEVSHASVDLKPKIQTALENIGHKVTHQLGSFHALMPNPEKTFEKFLSQLSPSEETAKRILENPIYKIFSQEFSGTQELMAMQRLLELSQDPSFETIILDTPPSRNTLTFLNAPQNMSRFFDEQVIRWVAQPTSKLLGAGLRKAFQVLESLTGKSFMAQFFDFAASLFEVQFRFSHSLSKVAELLESQDAGFLMVTTPSLETSSEALQFIKTLQERDFHFEGVALNRCLGDLPHRDQGLAEETVKEGHSLGARLVFEALQLREKKIEEDLKKEYIPICIRLAELTRDIHCLEDLCHVALAFNPVSTLPTDSNKPNTFRH